MDLLSPELSTGIGRIIIHSNEAMIHLWLLFRLDHGDKRSVPDLRLNSNSLQHSHANTHTDTHVSYIIIIIIVCLLYTSPSPRD